MPDYPNAITTKPTVVANDNLSIADSHNKPWDELIAVQTELGTLPKANYPSVKDRLDSIQPSTESWIKVDTGNNHGSTNTKIARFVNTQFNFGTAFTFADSATLGSTITINEDGIYYFKLDYGSTATSTHGGLSLNTSEPTINIQSLVNFADRMAIQITGAAGYYVNCSFMRKLTNGDIVRCHTDGGPGNTNNNVSLEGIKLRGVY